LDAFTAAPEFGTNPHLEAEDTNLGYGEVPVGNLKPQIQDRSAVKAPLQAYRKVIAVNFKRSR
jgi:hypothetical protein